MPDRRTLVLLALAALIGIGAGAAIGLIDDGPPPPEPRASTPPQAPGVPSERPRIPAAPPQPTAPPPRPRDSEAGASAGPSGPPPSSADELSAAATMRGYVAGLSDRRTGRVCATLAPEAVSALRFPVERGSCAASLRASLGHRRGRGEPRWKRSSVTDAIAADVDGDAARVVATVITMYRDGREPTVEDDIVYLRRDGRRWVIVKPSATILRAIGESSFGPGVLAPPR